MSSSSHSPPRSSRNVEVQRASYSDYGPFFPLEREMSFLAVNRTNSFMLILFIYFKSAFITRDMWVHARVVAVHPGWLECM